MTPEERAVVKAAVAWRERYAGDVGAPSDWGAVRERLAGAVDALHRTSRLARWRALDDWLLVHSTDTFEAPSESVRLDLRSVRDAFREMLAELEARDDVTPNGDTDEPTP